jgi:hypothetical protein
MFPCLIPVASKQIIEEVRIAIALRSRFGTKVAANRLTWNLRKSTASIVHKIMKLTDPS